MTIFILRSFYALIIITINTVIRLVRHERVSLTNTCPVEIVQTRDDERFP